MKATLQGKTLHQTVSRTHLSRLVTAMPLHVFLVVLLAQEAPLAHRAGVALAARLPARERRLIKRAAVSYTHLTLPTILLV